MTINSATLTEDHVTGWLFSNGLGPDEAIEMTGAVYIDITGRKSASPTAREVVALHLRRIYKRATGLRLA